MVAVIKPITQRVITRPQYRNTEQSLASFDTWHRSNQPLLWEHWCETESEAGQDEGASSDFLDFAKCQYDIACVATTDEDEWSPPRQFRSSDEYEAYEAGVKTRGEI